jgi:flagellar M-ring protein FliF
MRPLLKRVLSPEEQPLALPVTAEIRADGSPVPNIPAPPPMEEQRDPKAEVPAWMNDARQLGASQAATLKTVGELVKDNPKQAATIVRDWLTTAV